MTPIPFYFDYYTGSVQSGTDPEIFALDANGAVVPAWTFLPAANGAEWIKPPHDWGAYMHAKAYWDGPQAEISLSCGNTCHSGIVEGMQVGLRAIHKSLPPGASLACVDVVRMPAAILANAADPHIMLGCAPSFNAYHLPPIAVPAPRELPYRFSGCHLHFSSRRTPPSWYPDGTVVAMDKIAGIFLTALGRDWEDPIRRQFYGKPGEYRVREVRKTEVGKTPISYILEYRTPGSFLLRSPGILSLALDVARKAYQVGMVMDGRELALPDATDIILAGDADAAWDIIYRHRDAFEGLLERCYPPTNYGPDPRVGAAMTAAHYGLAYCRQWPAIADAWELDEAGVSHDPWLDECKHIKAPATLTA